MNEGELRMKIKESTMFLFSPDEIPMVINQTTHNDLNYSWAIYRKYWEHKKDDANLKTITGRHWETMCILAFMFNVGKIHGIRSERAKRRKKHEIRTESPHSKQ